MSDLDVTKINQLFENIFDHDMESVSGLSEEGRLVDLGKVNDWKGRNVKKSDDEVKCREALLGFLRSQEQKVNDFKRSIAVPVSDRNIIVNENDNTFESVYQSLKNIINSEAFVYYRAINKIDGFLENSPNPLKIEVDLNQLKSAIQDCINNVPPEAQTLILAKLSGHVAEKTDYASSSEAHHKKLVEMLSGIQKTLDFRPVPEKLISISASSQLLPDEFTLGLRQPKKTKKNIPDASRMATHQSKGVQSSEKAAKKASDQPFTMAESSEKLTEASKTAFQKINSSKQPMERITEESREVSEQPLTMSASRKTLTERPKLAPETRTPEQTPEKVAHESGEVDEQLLSMASSREKLTETSKRTDENKQTPKKSEEKLVDESWKDDEQLLTMASSREKLTETSKRTDEKNQTPKKSEEKLVDESWKDDEQLLTMASSREQLTETSQRTDENKQIPKNSEEKLVNESWKDDEQLLTMASSREKLAEISKRTDEKNQTPKKSEEKLVDESWKDDEQLLTMASSREKLTEASKQTDENKQTPKKSEEKLVNESWKDDEQLLTMNRSQKTITGKRKEASRTSAKNQENTRPVIPVTLQNIKSVQRTALVSINAINGRVKTETEEKIDEFLNAINHLKFENENPETLSSYIKRMKKSIESKKNSSTIRSEQKACYSKIFDAFVSLEARASEFLSTSLKNRESDVAVRQKEQNIQTDSSVKTQPKSQETHRPVPKKRKNKLTNAAPQRLKEGVAPGLYNWANTCFINGYLNYLMLSLSEKDIQALKDLTPQSTHMASNGLLEKTDPLALNLRDAVVALWQGYHKNPPEKDVISLQKDFLSACCDCAEARKQGNQKIPRFFAECFSNKTTSTGNIDFSRINQEDVTELEVAMNDFLLSRLPEQEFVFLQKKKMATLDGVNMSLCTKSEKQSGGLNVRVKDWTGQIRESMHEGLSELNSEFVSDIPVDWSVDELKQCGIDNKMSGVKLTTTVQDKLVIDSKTQRLTVKIQPFEFDGAASKLSEEAVDVFEKDGNPLTMELTDEKTGKSSKVDFRPRSIVCHQGKTPRSGHYFTLSFQEDGTVMIHNDSTVMDLPSYAKSAGYSENISVADFLRNQRATPYLIDYRKVSP